MSGQDAQCGLLGASGALHCAHSPHLSAPTTNRPKARRPKASSHLDTGKARGHCTERRSALCSATHVSPIFLSSARHSLHMSTTTTPGTRPFCRHSMQGLRLHVAPPHTRHTYLSACTACLLRTPGLIVQLLAPRSQSLHSILVCKPFHSKESTRLRGNAARRLMQHPFGYLRYSPASSSAQQRRMGHTVRA